MANENDAFPTIEPGEVLKCDRYYTDRHNNVSHFIYGGYEGIPENLLINVIAWLVSSFNSFLSTVICP